MGYALVCDDADLLNAAQPRGRTPWAVGDAFAFGPDSELPLDPARLAATGLRAILNVEQPVAGEMWDAATEAVVTRARRASAPNSAGFFDDLMQMFGGGNDVAGLRAMSTLNAGYPAFKEAVWRGGWRVGLVYLDMMLADTALTRPQYDAVQGIWDTNGLPRP